MPRPLHLPELLSPAGTWDCARAAVANGADAIYFGLPKFNARMRADNFSAEDLPELMRFLHKHGVKGYCAFNVLIFTSELASAEQQLRAMGCKLMQGWLFAAALPAPDFPRWVDSTSVLLNELTRQNIKPTAIRGL